MSVMKRSVDAITWYISSISLSKKGINSLQATDTAGGGQG
jgi:hypothetical protein